MASCREILRQQITDGSTYFVLKNNESDTCKNDAKQTQESCIISCNEATNVTDSSVNDAQKRHNAEDQVIDMKQNSPAIKNNEFDAYQQDSNGESLDFDLLSGNLSEKFSRTNSLDTRCQRILTLARLYLSDNISGKVPLSECLLALEELSDSHKYPGLAVCHALLLCSLTKVYASLNEVKSVEESISMFVDSLPFTEVEINVNDDAEGYSISVLTNELYESAHMLCKKLFHVSELDVTSIDVSTVCCLSLYNLSASVKNSPSECSLRYAYGKSTIKYILGLTGKSTQDIVSEGLCDAAHSTASTSSSNINVLNRTSYIIKQCLEILEHALSDNPKAHHKLMHHETYSLPHCLTRLLSWCISSLFPSGSLADDHFAEFHRKTLISVLKILSILTFSDYYESFSNVKVLMETLFICILKFYFVSREDCFDVLVLCLELLMNLHLTDNKVFAFICLKKYKVDDSEEILAVEGLIKILLNSLEKIKQIKSIETDEEVSSDMPEELSEENDKLQQVLQAAGNDMEHSTIVSFICVLLVFFTNVKQSFMEFIKKNVPLEMAKEALLVSKKFFNFVSLTGGMPESGILILRLTIKRLQKICCSY